MAHYLLQVAYTCGNDPNAVVDEIDWRYAFSLPISPVSLPPCRREAGSYTYRP
jgi:hypothetical protein